MEKHIWIKSLTIDDKGNFSNEMLIVLSPSLETRQLKLKATKDKTVNDALIKVSFTNLKARTYFYKNPIAVDGKEYVMYKRSASSSREGNVLFIRSDRFKEMDAWSNCGIEPYNPKALENFLAFQAYRALTLSGCENFITLEPKNILVINDLYSTFSARALSVTDRKPAKKDTTPFSMEIGEKIYTQEDYACRIKNCIWDGQGFLDDSVFDHPDIDNKEDRFNYRGKSMMILRNRFFKSCVFRTRLQKWFEDKGLTGEIKRDEKGNPIQINGYTEATCYEDIKMVVTYSSLKYIKFFDDPIAAIKQWMNTVENLFGIVKTDKKTPFFDGKYVRTNYQLLNTIFMVKCVVPWFLKPNKRMIERIGQDSKAFLAYVESRFGRDDDITEDREIDADKIFDSPFKGSKYFDPRLEVCSDLVKLNSKFDNTSFYRVFIRNYIKQLSKNIEIGKVLVRGTYATIVSNPYEMLNYIVKQYDIPPGQEGKRLMTGELYSKFFVDKADILGSRSPHILPGNILLVENKHDYLIDKYFVFNHQIVCINSIGSLILHRLNGSDQDGDAILLTDDKFLIGGAKAFARKSNDFTKFPVPVNNISEAERTPYIKKGEIDIDRFAKADHKLSDNLIGAIVNLSQKYNSILWDALTDSYRGLMSSLTIIYNLNSILEVLSNNEIDAAKGKTDFNAKSVLKELKTRANSYNPKDPLFFVGIEEKKKQKEIDKDPESKGKLAIGDDSTHDVLWSERTTADLGVLTFDEKKDSWVYKLNKKDFKRNEKTKELERGREITLLFACKTHPKSISRYSVLITGEKDLERFGKRIHKFNSVSEALAYKTYSDKELYLIKGSIRAFGRFNYVKYNTTMDYVYENATVKTPGGQGRAYTKLSDCYKRREGIAPKNNCEKITKEFIGRLIVAEKVRQIVVKKEINDEESKVLKKFGIEGARDFEGYKEYLLKCARFDGDSFFSSKDRIKSLIRKIDGNDDEDIRKAFYLALWLMFDDPKKKYKEIFEEDHSRDILTGEETEDLLFGA